jgi:hypothetical protein
MTCDEDFNLASGRPFAPPASGKGARLVHKSRSNTLDHRAAAAGRSARCVSARMLKPPHPSGWGDSGRVATRAQERPGTCLAIADFCNDICQNRTFAADRSL